MDQVTPEENEHLHELQNEEVAAKARVEGFGRFLVKRYKLNQGDLIENDGTITRIKQPDP